MAADEKLAALKTGLQQERTAYVTGQVQDRARLIDRHGAEDRQLQQAFVSRETLDQSAERVLQREQRRERGHEQDQQQRQEHGRGRSIGRDFSP